MTSLLVLDALYKCFSFSELSMTMVLSIFTLSILQGKLMKHSYQQLLSFVFSQGRLSLLEPSWSASCSSRATCPQLIASAQLWSCHLDTLSSPKMSKASPLGDSANVIMQSKETAHPKQRYKGSMGEGSQWEWHLENLEIHLKFFRNVLWWKFSKFLFMLIYSFKGFRATVDR